MHSSTQQVYQIADIHGTVDVVVHDVRRSLYDPVPFDRRGDSCRSYHVPRSPQVRRKLQCSFCCAITGRTEFYVVRPLA